jgi:predicted ATPase with chaperone activity
VTIEATLRDHTDKPRILGHVDAIVRESLHRVLAAFASSGVPSPRGSATLNFAPAGS